MKTVKLDNPITVEGIEVSELTFRPVKVRDCLAMERTVSSDFEKEVGLIANLASVTKETIWELYFADYMKIQEELKDFFHRLHKGLKAKCTNALFRCRWRD